MTDSQQVDNPKNNFDSYDEAVQQYVHTRLAYLSPMITGLITGLILGLSIFLATIFLILKGGEVVGPHLALLGQYFIGYEVSFAGSLIGFGYGLATGFVVGFLIAWLYNRFANMRAAQRKGLSR